MNTVGVYVWMSLGWVLPVCLWSWFGFPPKERNIFLPKKYTEKVWLIIQLPLYCILYVLFRILTLLVD